MPFCALERECSSQKDVPSVVGVGVLWSVVDLRTTVGGGNAQVHIAQSHFRLDLTMVAKICVIVHSGKKPLRGQAAFAGTSTSGKDSPL